MSMFRTRYRIVTDNYNGFEAQFRRWWMPFYCQCFFSNTSASMEKAMAIVKRHQKCGVVWSSEHPGDAP